MQYHFDQSLKGIAVLIMLLSWTPQTFVVGPKFKGVKMLPPGPHFISCNATSGSSGTDFAPTLGFFVHLAPRSVVVRRWDAQEELLLPIEDADEVIWH